MRTSVRLAWRGLRNSGARSALVVAAITVSIAGIGGVRQGADESREALHADSRIWLAADLCVDIAEPLTVEQADALHAFDWTLVTTSFTMAASDHVANPAVIFVKAIDPAVYPFYGEVLVEPGRLRDLQPDSAVVSREVLERLDVRVGDS